MRVEAIELHLHTKGTLVGFADLAFVDIRLRVFDCAVHQKNGKWWIRLPDKSYVTRDGEIRWRALLAFGDRDSEAEFQSAALAALRYPGVFPITLVKAREGT
jgi:hypothetical protein